MDLQEKKHRIMEEKEFLGRYRRLKDKREDLLLEAEEHRVAKLECEQKARSISQALREMEADPLYNRFTTA